MNHEEETNYRNKILLRVRNGEKITPQDRLWLATHQIINRAFGYPYLNTDIIQLHPKVKYIIRVKIESLKYPGRIIPVVTVPGGKGEIVINTPLADYNGNTVPKKAVKMLGLLVDLNHKEIEFTYQSSLGLLGISYECDYFDSKQHIMIRKNSGVGDPSFAILREVLSDNKILYRCKAPSNDSFDSFAFSIEWWGQGDGSVVPSESE